MDKNNMLCSRCKKRLAVIYMTRMENGQTISEGLCLKCAKELGLKPVDDLMNKMGLSEEDLDKMSDQMMEVMGDMEDGEDGFEKGGAMPFPFMQNLFGGLMNREQEEGTEAPPKNPRSEKPEKGAPKYKYLENYCENLTRKAREGKMDAIIGREKEIYRVVQILNRRTKNNPCLIGEPGVGKTAIAEGLAQRIAAGQVPFKLRDKEVYLLDLTALVAGTQFRGQFESRMKGLIEEIRKAGNIILVIDEVHNIVGAGDAEGSMNAANILKPALSRGEIQVIGATTFNEYRKFIEKDSALERRFQPVTVAEPNMEDTLEILKGIAHYYENFHGVQIPEGILRQAVALSERYITDRFLPDKAIDVLDEACSKVSLKGYKVPENFRSLEDLIKDLEKQKEDSIVAGDFAEASLIQKEQDEARKKLSALKKRFDKKQAGLHPSVTENEVAEVVSVWTKVPVSKLTESDTERLKNLEKILQKRVIGQDEAVSAVARAVKRGRVGLKDPKRPIGSFLFLGPTGVGKTELSKALAEALFGDENAMVRIDMSEYMEKHSVSRMVGSPPGYVGYEEGGQLSEKVRRNPYSVVLFDEIEKASPEVFNILLQVLDDGHITDGQGRKVDFKNTVIIMTSNAGARSIAAPKRLGFTSVETPEQSYEMMKKGVMDEIKTIFKPEFLNRIDDIIVFHPLEKEEITRIVRLLTDVMAKRVKENMNITVSFTKKAIEKIAEEGYDKAYGARPLRRAIQSKIEDAFAEEYLLGNIKAGDKVSVGLKTNGFSFRVVK